jgi:large subunit ribosomal protein L18
MDKEIKRNRRKIKIRKTIFGEAKVPRITVFRSNRYLYLQAIDDRLGKTIVSANTQKSKEPKAKQALTVASSLAEKLQKAKIDRAVFDRAGYKYHGLVKAIADCLREKKIKI